MVLFLKPKYRLLNVTPDVCYAIDSSSSAFCTVPELSLLLLIYFIQTNSLEATPYARARANNISLTSHKSMV